MTQERNIWKMIRKRAEKKGRNKAREQQRANVEHPGIKLMRVTVLIRAVLENDGMQRWRKSISLLIDCQVWVLHKLCLVVLKVMEELVVAFALFDCQINPVSSARRKQKLFQELVAVLEGWNFLLLAIQRKSRGCTLEAYPFEKWTAHQTKMTCLGIGEW